METIVSANNCPTPFGTNAFLGEVAEEPQHRRSFCERTITVIATAISHITMNFTFGIVKAIEVSITAPAKFLSHHGKKIGAPDSKLSRGFGIAGVFAGAIVTTVIAVPSLLLGAVFGLGKSIYKFPDAMQTSWNHGIRTALLQTIDSYNFDTDRIGCAVIIAALVCITAAFIPALSFGLIVPIGVAAALLVPTTAGSILSAILLTHIEMIYYIVAPEEERAQLDDSD